MFYKNKKYEGPVLQNYDQAEGKINFQKDKIIFKSLNNLIWPSILEFQSYNSNKI